MYVKIPSQQTYFAMQNLHRVRHLMHEELDKSACYRSAASKIFLLRRQIASILKENYHVLSKN